MRFFTIRNGNLEGYKENSDGDSLADFLTKYAEQVALNEIEFDYEDEKNCFKRVFETLDKTLGPDAFSAITQRGHFAEQFHVFHFEAITVALSKFWQKLDARDNPLNDKIKAAIISLKKDPKFGEATENKLHKRTNGSQYLKFLRQRISIAESTFEKIWSK